MKEFCKRFLKQLKFWTLHCSLTALPSFFIVQYLLIEQNLLIEQRDKSPIPAMLTGILIFILGYTTLGTVIPALNREGSLLSKATRLALKIRMGISLVSLPLVFSLSITPSLIAFIPDVWSGLAAGYLISFLFNTTTFSPENFGYILSMTLLEGLIISFFLFIGTFFCLLFMNRRQNKKIMENHSLSEQATK